MSTNLDVLRAVHILLRQFNLILVHIALIVLLRIQAAFEVLGVDAVDVGKLLGKRRLALRFPVGHRLHLVGIDVLNFNGEFAVGLRLHADNLGGERFLRFVVEPFDEGRRFLRFFLLLRLVFFLRLVVVFLGFLVLGGRWEKERETHEEPDQHSKAFHGIHLLGTTKAHSSVSASLADGAAAYNEGVALLVHGARSMGIL